MKLTLSCFLLALLCGCQKHEAPSGSTGAPPIVSAEKTSFDEVTAKLDKGGDLYAFLDTQQALSGLAAKMSGISNFVSSLPSIPEENRGQVGNAFHFLDNLVKDSGVEEVAGVGLSSIAREPGFYYSKTVLYHYPGQESGMLWSLFGKAPHRLDELDLVPTNAALVCFSDFDLPLLWTNLQSELDQLGVAGISQPLHQWPEQFHRLTSLNFDATLASLGGNYGIILTLDDNTRVTLPLGQNTMQIPSPALAIIARVKSDVIFDRVDQALKGNPLLTSVNEPELKMRSMLVPLPLPINLRPTVARSGDYLIIATTDAMVRQIVGVKAGKEQGIKSTAEFKKLSQGIPDEGNSFTLVTSHFANLMAEIQEQTMAMGSNTPPGQGEFLRSAFGSGTNGDTYTVGINSGDGWEAIANGTHKPQAALIPAAAGGLIAAIAVPNFIRARETAQYNSIVNNLRILDSAKQRWASEKNKENGDSVTMDDITSYLSNPITPVANEKYMLNAIGTPTTARLAGSLAGHAAGSQISAE